MDKIWDRNPSKSEVIGCCGGDEKRMTMLCRQQSNAKKTKRWLKNVVFMTQTYPTFY